MMADVISFVAGQTHTTFESVKAGCEVIKAAL